MNFIETDGNLETWFKVFIIVILVAAATVATAVQLTSQDPASGLASVLVALATIALVITGFLSYKENRKLVAETQKDRRAAHVRNQIEDLYASLLELEGQFDSERWNVSYQAALKRLKSIMNQKYYLAGPKVKESFKFLAARPGVKKVVDENGSIGWTLDDEGEKKDLRDFFEAARADLEVFAKEYAEIVTVEKRRDSTGD